MCGEQHHCGSHETAEEGQLSDRGLMTVALDLLKEEPGTGLSLLDRLEDRLEGLFVVGPAGVYPILQLAQDLGYVKVSTEGDKQDYALTDEGRKFLEERSEALQGFWDRVNRGRYGLEVHEVIGELRTLARAFVHQAQERRLEAAQLDRIREAIALAHKAIEDQLAS